MKPGQRIYPGFTLSIQGRISGTREHAFNIFSILQRNYFRPSDYEDPSNLNVTFSQFRFDIFPISKLENLCLIGTQRINSVTRLSTNFRGDVFL